MLIAISNVAIRMDSFPVLYTARLILRKLTVDDIRLLVKYANNRKISDNVLNIPFPYNEPDAVFRISYVVQGFKKKERYVFAIEDRDTEKFIGEISLHLDIQKNIAQLSYWVGEPFWGNGFATEAASAIIQFSFEKLQLAMIFAECRVDNLGSEKVMMKNKMTRRGINGNVVQYMMMKEEYFASE